jgi:hypothetical protein
VVLKAEKIMSWFFELGDLKCGIQITFSNYGTSREKNKVEFSRRPIKPVIHYVVLYNEYLMIITHAFSCINDVSPYRMFSVNFERAYEFYVIFEH